MSIRNPKGEQLQDIPLWCPATQHSFNLDQDDGMIVGQGISYTHYKAIPSPIGLKDRGDYRRDGLDTITANGAIYVCIGKFTGTEIDNVRSRERIEGGLVDPSTSHLLLPRFYNKMTINNPGQLDTNPEDDGKRIYLDIGDRLYVSDPNADTLVSWTQKMTFELGPNVPMFPIVKMSLPIIDSQGIYYNQGIDFCIDSCGNINWLNTGNNPGIDPATGTGRVFSVAYLYKSYYYIISLPHEVRMTNITKNGVRVPERMAYNAVIQREYIYHDQNRGNKQNNTASKTPQRAVQEPFNTIKPGAGEISVDMINISEDGLQD